MALAIAKEHQPRLRQALADLQALQNEGMDLVALAEAAGRVGELEEQLVRKSAVVAQLRQEVTNLKQQADLATQDYAEAEKRRCEAEAELQELRRGIEEDFLENDRKLCEGLFPQIAAGFDPKRPEAYGGERPHGSAGERADGAAGRLPADLGAWLGILRRAGLSPTKLSLAPDLLRQFVERIEKASSARLVDNGDVMRHHLVEAFDLLPKMKD